MYFQYPQIILATDFISLRNFQADTSCWYPSWKFQTPIETAEYVIKIFMSPHKYSRILING